MINDKKHNKIINKTLVNFTKGFFNKSLPSYLILFVNNICQLRCDMCFYWDSMQKKTTQLSLNEIEKLSKSLPNLLQLTLTGGEPSLRKDLSEIPKIFAKYSNLSKCTVVTNGMLPERIKNQVNTFVKENPSVDFRISISMDGIGKLHDKIRGVEGSFENAEKTLGYLFKIRDEVPNLWIDINTTISKYNCEEFENIHNFIIKNYPVDNHVCGFTRGKTKEDDAKEIPIDYYTKAKNLIAKTRKLRKHPLQTLTSIVTDTVRDEVERELQTETHDFDCTAGSKFIEVYQDGNVSPCEILETITTEGEHKMGNLKDFDYDMQKLLKSDKAKKVIKFIKDSKCHCTFECPKYMDVLYNKKFYPKLFKNSIKRIIK